jgi:hypothetical protein
MRRDDIEPDQMPGQDSFLDVITNIVGILILLVLVVGLRTSRSVSQSSSANTAQKIQGEDLRLAIREAVSMQHDVDQLARRAVSVHGEMLLKEREREFLGTYVASGEQEIAEMRARLSEQQQSDFDLRRQLAIAQHTLDDLTREQLALLSDTHDEVEEVTNLPTPLAETVTGKEIHLRLARGHVAIIPLEELLKEFKTHAEANLWRLREEDQLVSTIGPIDGFRLRYILARRQYAARTQTGLEQRGTVIQLVRWELIPVTSELGEPVDQALAADADLKQRLQRSSPDATTVTVWTYPDSFGNFRTLKEALFELGYATAARPLPNGILIGGSPSGSRSAAQ